MKTFITTKSVKNILQITSFEPICLMQIAFYVQMLYKPKKTVDLNNDLIKIN